MPNKMSKIMHGVDDIAKKMAMRKAMEDTAAALGKGAGGAIGAVSDQDMLRKKSGLGAVSDQDLKILKGRLRASK